MSQTIHPVTGDVGTFNVQLAVNLGDVNSAILYEWLDNHSRNLQPDENGLKWLFVSCRQISEALPFYSTKQVRKLLQDLLDQGMISVCPKNMESKAYAIKGGI